MTGAPFDWRYLAFVQNYTGMPYWAVSWSLCVEEHVYLALPLVLGLALRVRGGVPLALAAAALGSLAARVLTVPDGASPWGFQYTATHMRLEGIALGVAAAYVAYRMPAHWPAVRRAGRWLALPGLAFVASVPWLPLDVLNRFAYAGVDLAFAAVLVAVVERPALPLATSGAVRALALTSYSVYMTHTVVLDLYRRTAMKQPASVAGRRPCRGRPRRRRRRRSRVLRGRRAAVAVAPAPPRAEALRSTVSSFRVGVKSVRTVLVLRYAFQTDPRLLSQRSRIPFPRLHGAQSVHRFDGSFVPPFARATLWSTWSRTSSAAVAPQI